MERSITRTEQPDNGKFGESSVLLIDQLIYALLNTIQIRFLDSIGGTLRSIANINLDGYILEYMYIRLTMSLLLPLNPLLLIL